MNSVIVPFLIPPKIITAIGAVERCLLAEAKISNPQKVLIVSDEILLRTGMVDTNKKISHGRRLAG